MIVYYVNDEGKSDLEIYNGAADMLERLKAGSAIDKASNFMLRSDEMLVELIPNTEGLIQIASEILRTENANTKLNTYWQASEHFRSKEYMANKVREVLGISDEELVTDVMVSMLQSSFYGDISESELEKDIQTAYEYCMQ